MVGVSWFFGFGSMMEFIAFVITIAVAYQALKAYNLSKEKTLLYLNLSFVLIGAGLLIDGLSGLIVLLARLHREFFYLFGVGYTINFIAQLIAYGLLVYAYVHQARNVTAATQVLAAVPVLFFQRNA